MKICPHMNKFRFKYIFENSLNKRFKKELWKNPSTKLINIKVSAKMQKFETLLCAKNKHRLHECYMLSSEKVNAWLAWFASYLLF